MWKRTSKISTINILTFFLWNIYIFASRTIYLKFLCYFTLTLDVFSSSLIPIGNTACLSHKTRGHTPNFPYTNFSRININPF